MAPEKTDPESGDETPNTSTVSIDSSIHEVEREPYFEPVVHLPEVQTKTNEEEESELLKLRCKLFRYHTQESLAEWKERGTGDVKILQHNEKNTIRILMRQDKTLKVRANHYITPFMELKRNCNSDRAWVWSVGADFADEETKHETFAIRFANVDHAKQFKEKFDEAKGMVTVAFVRGKEALSDENEALSDENEAESISSKKVVVEACSVSPSVKTPSADEDISTNLVAKELEKLSVKIKDNVEP